MKIYISIIIFLSTDFLSYSQNTLEKELALKKNSIFLELMGNTPGFGSINYERKFLRTKHSFSTARIGFSPFDELYFPFSITRVFHSERKNHFELGGGYTLSIDKNNFKTRPQDYALIFDILYRYEVPGGNSAFRLGWTPLFFLNRESPYTTSIPGWGAFSGGWTF